MYVFPVSFHYHITHVPPCVGSDLMGRSTVFNATLFFSSIFGLLAFFANSFVTLCIILFFLGSAVGVRHFCNSAERSYPDDCILLFVGVNPDRWHASSRAHAARETLFGHRPVRLLLLRLRSLLRGSPTSASPALLHRWPRRPLQARRQQWLENFARRTGCHCTI